MRKTYNLSVAGSDSLRGSWGIIFIPNEDVQKFQLRALSRSLRLSPFAPLSLTHTHGNTDPVHTHRLSLIIKCGRLLASEKVKPSCVSKLSQNYG